MDIRSNICEWIDTADASNLGYDQGQRFSFLDKSNHRINRNTETDCSALSSGIWWLAGAMTDDAISHEPYTGNIEEYAVASNGSSRNIEGWSKDQIMSVWKPGDMILGPGHVVLVSNRKDSSGNYMVLSAEGDERGQASGGQAGDQTGKEVVIKSMYMRSRGWTRILSPNTTTAANTSSVTTTVLPLLHLNDDGGASGQQLKHWLHANFSYAANVDDSNGFIGNDTWKAMSEFASRVGLLAEGATLSAWGPKCWSAAKNLGF